MLKTCQACGQRPVGKGRVLTCDVCAQSIRPFEPPRKMGVRDKWSCPLHGDTIVRCCGQALRIGWGAGPEHKSYQCPCGSPVENHVPNGIHCRRGL